MEANERIYQDAVDTAELVLRSRKKFSQAAAKAAELHYPHLVQYYPIERHYKPHPYLTRREMPPLEAAREARRRIKSN